MVVTGAVEAGLDDTYINHHLKVATDVDPLAPGLRVADDDDLPRMRTILSAAISDVEPRYSAHPGDLNWWTYHGDPRSGRSGSYTCLRSFEPPTISPPIVAPW